MTNTTSVSVDEIEKINKMTAEGHFRGELIISHKNRMIVSIKVYVDENKLTMVQILIKTPKEHIYKYGFGVDFISALKNTMTPFLSGEYPYRNDKIFVKKLLEKMGVEKSECFIYFSFGVKGTV